jgi:hypothetical protein
MAWQVEPWLNFMSYDLSEYIFFKLWLCVILLIHILNAAGRGIWHLALTYQ